MDDTFERSLTLSFYPILTRNEFSHEMVRGMAVGGTTGCITQCLTFPAEFVKTKMQLDGKMDAPRYQGNWDCVKQITRKNGVYGLYKGLPIALSGKLAAVSCRFGAAEYLKSKTVGETGVLSTQQKVICGFGAGIAEAVFAVTPFETIKVKYIQVQGQSKPCGIIQETKNILKKEGAHGIYQGVTATVLKLGVDQMIKFVIMDLLKDFYKNRNDTKEVPLLILAMTGVTAASVAVFMSTPLDVVKTRMQSFQGRDFKNFVHCVKTIWKDEKLMGFYKGTLPRLSRGCVDLALTQVLYGMLSEQYNRLSNRD
ncbi:hypothetical protein CRE_22459 [Caenorhabditis remanei]|uniref:Citrate transport protein n=1 Tax=Caenorhabditis remanei TaxID=31234 RepID=E3MEA7_CAERE|nr:hypothetical protein CRE_22459 [Caenorhabditis remanei]